MTEKQLIHGHFDGIKLFKQFANVFINSNLTEIRRTFEVSEETNSTVQTTNYKNIFGKNSTVCHAEPAFATSNLISSLSRRMLSRF